MQSITLIGMPGSGKSTIGCLIAERIAYDFVDLDELITTRIGESLSEFILKHGEAELLHLEESFTLDANLKNVIFSPGGSIIYSERAMEKLSRETKIIYLELPYDEIVKRLNPDLEKRGIIGLKEKGLYNLYLERTPLYTKFSDHIISCINLTKEEIVELILLYVKITI